jgi:hypothetical protein
VAAAAAAQFAAAAAAVAAAAAAQTRSGSNEIIMSPPRGRTHVELLPKAQLKSVTKLAVNATEIATAGTHMVHKMPRIVLTMLRARAHCDRLGRQRLQQPPHQTGKMNQPRMKMAVAQAFVKVVVVFVVVVVVVIVVVGLGIVDPAGAVVVGVEPSLSAIDAAEQCTRHPAQENHETLGVVYAGHRSVEPG